MRAKIMENRYGSCIYCGAKKSKGDTWQYCPNKNCRELEIKRRINTKIKNYERKQQLSFYRD